MAEHYTTLAEASGTGRIDLRRLGRPAPRRHDDARLTAKLHPASRRYRVEDGQGHHQVPGRVQTYKILNEGRRQMRASNCATIRGAAG